MAKILRPFQVDVKREIYNAWNQGHKNVLLVKPTGLGKTVTFCSIAIDLAVTPIEKEPTVILVHRKELVQQISLTLSDEGIVHNIIAPRSTIKGIIAAQRFMFRKQFYDYNAPITVVSVDTLNARIERHEKWAKGIKRWITDEAAHLLKINKWGRAVGYFPNALGLGVTATPQRLDKRGLGRHADGVFDVMVQGPTTKWGIDNGFLSKYKIAVPQSDYRNYLSKASGDSDYSKEAMALASSQSHIIGDVVTNYIKFANGKQAILFASDIVSAKKMETKFKEQGITAKLLTSESDDKDRLQSMIDFRDKKIKVLLNVDLFDEGLDVPGIECVIMARPTMSLSKYLQMIGRGLRPAPGKEFLIVIDHVGNVPEHGLPDSHRRWTLDRIVKRRDKTNLIRICANWNCNSPFDRVLTACPYCGEEVGKTSSGGGAGRIQPKQVDGDLELLDAETLREMYDESKLEDPAIVAARVARAAGGPAGIKAMKQQAERIETQKHLVNIIAVWAGRIRSQGYSDRQIHKKFYLTFGERTITECLSEPRKEMLKTIDEIMSDLKEWVNETRVRDSAVSADRIG
jgi:DNA repair protein RadD